MTQYNPTHYIKTGVIGLIAVASTAIGTAAFAPAYASPMTDFVRTISASISSDAVEAERGIQTIVASGTFKGASDHETRGTVRIVKVEDGYELRLGSDFYLDGAPTPVLGFGIDGEYIHATQFADLDRKRGEQVYRLPASFDPASVTEAFVWCERFDIPLGVAELTTA